MAWGHGVLTSMVKEDDTMHPMAATGEFNAAIGGLDDIARISGAFAATKQ